MQKLIKKIIYGLTTLMLLLGFAPNVFAATAYSVGSKFATGTNYAGDDFTANALNAASAYYKISDLSSYYNLASTYSYLQSNSRLGGSRVFFINGHANNAHIISGAYNSTDYKTGVSIGYDGDTYSGYKTAGLNSRSMSGTRVITFTGCSTAGYVGNTNNLTDRAVARGATAALGWYESIYSRSYYGPEWLSTYNNNLGNGKSMINSIYAAKVAYPGSNLSDYYAYRGNRDIAITASGIQKSGSMVAVTLKDYDLNVKTDISDASNFIETTSDLSSYKTIKTSDIEIKSIQKIIRNENLSDYNTLFKDVITQIQLEDSSFNTDDYKVTYHIANEDDGYGDIYFTYYIDNKIETNKVYIITFDKYKVTDIVLGGVKIENMNNITNLSTESIHSKIKSFEAKKAEMIYAKAQSLFNENIKNNKSLLLEKDNKVNISSLNGNIIQLEETYYYDYNTNELKYYLTYAQNIDGLYDAHGIDISL